MAIKALKNLLVGKNGKFQFQIALEKMGWNTEKFEEELEVYAKTQTPQLADRMRKEYNRFMSGCGWPLELVDVDSCCDCLKIRVPKQKESESDVVIDESQYLVEKEASSKVEVPQKTTPLPPPVSEAEKKVEEPKTAPEANIDIAAKATAYLSFSDANYFKKLYDSMCLLVSEITWKITDVGLSMRQMDPCSVAMIDLTIGKEKCMDFTVSTPGLVTFDAEDVKDVVFAKAFKKGTSIGIKIDGEANKITFIITDAGSRERTFPTRTTAIDKHDFNTPLPKISFNAKCKVLSKQIAKDLKDLKKLSDHFTITATVDNLLLEAGGDCGNGENKYVRGDETLLDVEVKEQSKVTLSFHYLKDMIQPVLCDVVVLELATDMPIKVMLPTKLGHLTYYVAPRIECD